MSVLARPMLTTSTPWPVTPSAKASTSCGDDSRMSWPTTTAGPPTRRVKAAPTSRTTSASSSSPTTPRMSYALTIPDRSRTLHPPQTGISTMWDEAYRRSGASCGCRTLPSCSSRCPLCRRSFIGRIGQRPEMPAANPAVGQLFTDDRTVRLLARLTHCLGQRGQIVVGGNGRGELAFVPDNLPALGHGESQRMGFAKVVAVRLGIRGQRADDRGGVRIGISERGDSRVRTPRSRATPHAPHESTIALLAGSAPQARGNDGQGDLNGTRATGKTPGGG